ncbi:hypothetical protein B0H13DRAFT_2020731, partial [Mycena leptocephala]
MSTARRNVTTEGLHVQKQRAEVEGVCVGIRLYVMDGAKGGSGWEGISSRQRKRDVQRKKSFPNSPCVQSLRQPAAHARALPVVPVARARSRPVPFAVFGVGVEIRDSGVRWAKTRARPNASAVAWLQRDEVECKCERGRIACPEKYILAGGTSDPQGNTYECESRARGWKSWRPSAKNLAYILFHRARARIPKKYIDSPL